MKLIRKGVSILGVLLLLFVMAQTGITAHAANNIISSTQQKLNEAEEEKRELENKQEESQSELYGLKQEKNTLQGELYDLHFELEQASYRLEDITDQIMLKEADIQTAEDALSLAQEKVDKQYADMVIRVRQMYERNEKNMLNAILGAGSLAKMLNAENYFSKIESYDKNQLKELKESRAAIEEQKIRLENEKIALYKLKEDAQLESNRVSELVDKTKAAVDKYGSEISATEKQIEEYEKAIKEREEDIEELKKILEEERKKSALAQNSAWRDISQVTFEDGDRYLLANLIYCEAGGEPYDGQVAVGAVVINRVLSSVYPDTVTGVIYQRSQFSPAGSGRLEIALAQNKATDSCYRAADEAMSGFSNVGTCVYFRTPIPGLTGISIGGHIFY